MYAQDSLDLLKQSGIDFEANALKGINVKHFAELLMCSGVVLNEEEKAVYAAMRRYRLIELNMGSTLIVKVPWTPEKTKEVGDVKVKCRSCGIR